MEKANRPPCLAFKSSLLKKFKKVNKITGFFPPREDPITWLENFTQLHCCVFKMFRLQHQRDGMGSAHPGFVCHHQAPFLSLNQTVAASSKMFISRQSAKTPGKRSISELSPCSSQAT